MSAAVLLVALVLLVLRVPVVVAIGLAATAGLLVDLPPGPALVTAAQRSATGLDSFTLLAIPFFILAGQLMDRGGIARRLVDLARAALAGLPAGLAHVQVAAAMLFGALSGSAVATASAMGSVLGPRLEEDGYERPFAAALNVTSATTGLVIPPSNVLIVYSLASGGVSVAALFLAGYLPGLLIGLLLMVAAALTARRRAVSAGDLEADGTLAGRLLRALPALGLPVVVMGGILLGWFTATEASAIAVLYAGGLALASGEVRIRDLPDILVEAATTTGTVMLLIGVSMALSWVLAYAHVPERIAEAVLRLGDDPLTALLLINVTLLVVGTVLDMTPAVLIFTPIFLPVAHELGIDPIQFGIILVLNLCIGLCTPPVGTVLFVGCSVANVRVTEILRPILPFYLAMLVALAAVCAFPALSLWLPGVYAR